MNRLYVFVVIACFSLVLWGEQSPADSKKQESVKQAEIQKKKTEPVKKEQKQTEKKEEVKKEAQPQPSVPDSAEKKPVEHTDKTEKKASPEGDTLTEEQTVPQNSIKTASPSQSSSDEPVKKTEELPKTDTQAVEHTDKPAVVPTPTPTKPATPIVEQTSHKSPQKQLERQKPAQIYLEEKREEYPLETVSKYVEIYGKLTGHMAIVGDDTFRLEDNGSRFGFKASAPVGFGITLLGRAEMALNLMHTKKSLNHDTDHEGSFVKLNSNIMDSSLYMRLGYLGVDFGPFGAITFGKQWSVYYDYVAKWTDRFEVFGADALAVFGGGTDGGLTGLGRADQAVEYRFAFKGLHIGMQLQAKDDYSGIRSLNPGVYYTAPFGLSVGVSYNHLFLDDKIWNVVPGYSGDDGYAIAAGLKFTHSFGNHSMYVAATFSYTENHDAVSMPRNDTASEEVLFKTIGFEAYAQYAWKNIVKVYGGYNFMLPQDMPARYFHNMHTNYMVLGMKAGPKPWAYAYLEGKFDFGQDRFGDELPNAVTLGLTINFSTTDMIKAYVAKQQHKTPLGGN